MRLLDFPAVDDEDYVVYSDGGLYSINVSPEMRAYVSYLRYVGGDDNFPSSHRGKYATLFVIGEVCMQRKDLRS